MAKKIDYKAYSKDELTKLVSEKREELRSLRFNVAGSKTRDVKTEAKLRKVIARALTAMTAQK